MSNLLPGLLFGGGGAYPSSQQASSGTHPYGTAQTIVSGAPTWMTGTAGASYQSLEIKYLDNQFYCKRGKILTEIDVSQAIKYIELGAKCTDEVKTMAKMLE